MDNRRTPHLNELRKRKYRAIRALMSFLAISVLLVTGDYYSYPAWSRVNAPTFNRGSNAMWIPAPWMKGPLLEQERIQLAKAVNELGIRRVFVGLTMFPSGSKRLQASAALSQLTGSVRLLREGMQVYLWATPSSLASPAIVRDLENPKLRSSLLSRLRWWMDQAEVDGILLDARDLPDTGEGLITLLKDLRETLPGRPKIGLVAPSSMPLPLVWRGWSENYLRRAANAADQIVLACSGKGFFLPRSYVWFIERQAIVFPRAVAAGSSRGQVLLGLPKATAESGAVQTLQTNVALALAGIREGLNQPSSNADPFQGIVIHAEDLMVPEIAKTVRDYWVIGTKQPPQQRLASTKPR